MRPNDEPKVMYPRALSQVLIVSALLGTCISTSWAQNDDSDFIEKRKSYPFWNNSLKRDIEGFKPGMTESEVKHRIPNCEITGYNYLCRVSKDELFEFSFTQHTKPPLVKDVTYIFPAGGATLETMAKNVTLQFGAGNSRPCLPLAHGLSGCFQWQLEDGAYMRLGVNAYRSDMVLYLSTPKWITSLEEQAFEKEQGNIPSRKF